MKTMDVISNSAKCFIFQCVIVIVGLFNYVSAQTNPFPQSLPYTQSFADLEYSSTVYPDGWQGWRIAGNPGSVFKTDAPTEDKDLYATPAGVTASYSSGNVLNYDGKIGFLNTTTADYGIVLAVNTTGKDNLKVNYDIMTIRNPYNGSNNTRINEVTLQYRVGVTGDFTNLTGIEYQNNNIEQTAATTEPQKLESKSITLPSVCDDKPVVQLRWISRQISGGGTRPSFAIDNVNVGLTTSVKDMRLHGLQVYNIDNRIAVKNKSILSGRVHVFNAIGQCIYSELISSDYVLLGQVFNAGIYLLRIDNSHQSMATKVIIK